MKITIELPEKVAQGLWCCLYPQNTQAVHDCNMCPYDVLDPDGFECKNFLRQDLREAWEESAKKQATRLLPPIEMPGGE